MTMSFILAEIPSGGPGGRQPPGFGRESAP
jgi:hypothetical protein